MHSLDDLLDSSAPELAEPEDGLQDALADLVVASRSPTARGPKPRRAVLVGATTAIFMVGGTAAASVTMSGWIAPWAEDPVGTMTFKLPSGTVCEQRIGDLHLDNRAAEKMIHGWLSEHALDEIAEVDAQIAASRAEKHSFIAADGSRSAAGYGTPYWDADYEYVDAVYRAETEAITAKLTDEGFTEYFDYGWASELQCSGPNPTPGMPPWLK